MFHCYLMGNGFVRKSQKWSRCGTAGMDPNRVRLTNYMVNSDGD